MRGGEGVHVVEACMFCTICLKTSCLLICFHSWSLDLSQTLIQTIQILRKEKQPQNPWKNKKQGGPENPKARWHTARLFLKMLWCGQLCSGRNRFKIFTETSCALMVSGATIHHSMLCQLCLHSSSRYCFSCN